MSVGKEEGYSCEHFVPIEQEPRHHLVFENEFVRAFAVEIAPHQHTLCHHHPNDYLLFVALGADIVSAARDEEPKRFSYRNGECELAPAGLIHVVENLSDTPFRNVVVELLPAASGLRRGSPPQRVSGEVTITPVFNDARAAIFSTEIAAGAEVEIRGPAVLTSPYGGGLSPDAVDEVEIQPNPISDIAWVPSQYVTNLFGCWQSSGTVIVFQIGGTDERELMALNQTEPLRSLQAHADESE
jgi:hypothetical protein